MVIQGGEVVDGWRDFDTRIDAYSVRKSLIGALYGIYSSEGAIEINLEQLGIEDAPIRAGWSLLYHSIALLLESTFQEKPMNCNRNFPTPLAVGRISQQR